MDIDRLSRAVARDGLAAHAGEVAAAADAARDAAPGAVAALLDPDLPEVMRLRAFAVVARTVAAGRRDAGRRGSVVVAGTVSR